MGQTGKGGFKARQKLDEKSVEKRRLPRLIGVAPVALKRHTLYWRKVWGMK